MKTNRIIMTILCLIVIAFLVYFLFGPPHYWDTVSPGTLKKSNELVDSYLDKIQSSSVIDFTARINIHDYYVGTGYIDTSNTAAIDCAVKGRINKDNKTVSLNVETTGMPEGIVGEQTVDKCQVDLSIDNNTMTVIRVSDKSNETHVYDGAIVRAFDKLFFEHDLSFCKTENGQYEKYRDNDSTIRYQVIRDISLEDIYSDLSGALSIKDATYYNHVRFTVSLIDNEPKYFDISIDATEDQSYFVKVLEFLIGSYPFELNAYEQNVSLTIK